jgi:rubrerythrin
MSDKPSYLGLLNAIAVAEAAAEDYLTCWAEVTQSDEVRGVLRVVALREGEHAKAFEKRICELGFGLRPKPADPAQSEIAASTTLTDREKFEKLRLGQEPGGEPDVFTGMFADKTIDIQTGALLGRYIAEERDSGRLFRACYQQLCEGEQPGAASSELAEVRQRLDRIEATLNELAEKG